MCDLLTSSAKCTALIFVVYAECGEDTRLITAREALKNERRSSYSGYYHIDGKGWAKAP